MEASEQLPERVKEGRYIGEAIVFVLCGLEFWFGERDECYELEVD